jgi:(p)ppGpp synthase/HD superfamily hydrolase
MSLPGLSSHAPRSRKGEVAPRCHQGHLRYSGDPYSTHPVAVATILARLSDAGEVDDRTLCAAILHDTVQDTPYALAALRRDFGTEIATMMTGHMALDRLGRRPRCQVTQVTQVMTTIMSADARVVATKLADRLHNMQTLQVLPWAKQLRKAREVLDTFQHIVIVPMPLTRPAAKTAGPAGAPQIRTACARMVLCADTAAPGPGHGHVAEPFGP